MWLATEINLHHENTIKEAFNRTAAAKDRKIYWDLNLIILNILSMKTYRQVHRVRKAGSIKCQLWSLYN